MENLIFSLNATMPVFLLMLLGLLFRRLGLVTPQFVDDANQFVFKVALPVLLFDELSLADIVQVWEGAFVVFCLAITAVSIVLVWWLSKPLGDLSQRGEFVQAAFRSSATLMGVAFVRNIYGQAGIGPLMVLASVPLYNVASVIVLALTAPGRGGLSRSMVARTLRDIAVNPLILGIVAGVTWALLRLPQPLVMQKTLTSLHSVATPLGLIAMGASFEARNLGRGAKSALAAAAVKLLLLCAIFLPLAVALGFRYQALVAIAVMLGSPTTVTCFVMARNMGHRGDLTAKVVALTTLGSSFTLTLWLYLLRSWGLI